MEGCSRALIGAAILPEGGLTASKPPGGALAADRRNSAAERMFSAARENDLFEGGIRSFHILLGGPVSSPIFTGERGTAGARPGGAAPQPPKWQTLPGLLREFCDFLATGREKRHPRSVRGPRAPDVRANSAVCQRWRPRCHADNERASFAERLCAAVLATLFGPGAPQGTWGPANQGVPAIWGAGSGAGAGRPERFSQASGIVKRGRP
jgi:hypothetical protein